MRLCVGHLPWSTTEEALERLFASYGLVDSTQIAPAGMGSGARVGFVEMPDTTEARAAIAGLQGHDPTHEDIRAFLRRLKTALTARDLALCGVTTDGSALYPAPLREVFGQVRHQICTFHIMAEIGKAVLGAVTSARKGLAATQPKLRGSDKQVMLCPVVMKWTGPCAD